MEEGNEKNVPFLQRTSDDLDGGTVQVIRYRQMFFKRPFFKSASAQFGDADADDVDDKADDDGDIFAHDGRKPLARVQP